ncbi:MAG TPA: cytochrome c peroxidase [Vicinamibacterales bacterium]|nr:cytochrome c peroxidase [Vicinamibacterales bacterium]
MMAVPLGLSALIPVPADNPLTAAKVALGRRLFFEKRLSRDGRVACASCHKPEHGFADDRALSIGVGGRVGGRNAPSLLNKAYARTLFWDGRAASLEEQALAPMVNDVELANTYEEISTRLGSDPSYVAAFREAFGGAEPTSARAAQALASFTRTLLSGASPVDRYERLGEATALSPAAARGHALFRGKARCHVCHDGPLFSDDRFHNTGVGWGRAPVDRGRYAVTGVDAHRGAFRTPSLRHVARTAPYMHDGSMTTLSEIVAFYDRGAGSNPYLDGLIRPLGLTSRERRDLVAFLESLTGRD